MNAAQMDAIFEVIDKVLSGDMRLFVRDVQCFREMSNVLRSLISTAISLSRKKNTLQRFQQILPRLLRAYYLDQTVMRVMRSAEL